MCNCYTEITNKVTEKVKADAPIGAENFDIELGGFLFGMSDAGLTHRSSNALTIKYTAPKKSGGTKNVTQKSFVRATFCPFCGVKYSASEGAAQ